MNDTAISGPCSPGLHARDERWLFERLRETGDPHARDELVSRNLRLAMRLARRYSRSHESMDDLMQVAAMGLVKAVDRYDPAHGTTFATFATPTILGELRRHFRDTRWAVHVPRRLQERVQAVAAAQDRLVTELGRSATASEVASAIGIEAEDVLEAREAARAIDAASLDAPSAVADDEDEITRDVFGEVDPGFELVEDRETIQPALALLSLRERRTLRMRFDEDMTQSEIGERLGISQMHVSRILRAAVDRVRAVTAEQRVAA